MATGAFTYNSPLTNFLVVYMRNLNSYRVIYDGFTKDVMSLSGQEGNNIRLYGGGFWTGNAAVINTWYYHTLVSNGASSFTRLNGDQTANENHPALTTGGLSLSHLIGGQYANMDLAEFFGYNTALSSANITLCETYLKDKYGIA
jgi:hypothetical protein